MTEAEAQSLLDDLDSDDWSVSRDAVERAGSLLRARKICDHVKTAFACRFLRLASHQKWEVRKAVACAVLFLRHDSFHAIIARLIDDDNAWVKDAARKTLQRRGDLSRADCHNETRGDAILALLSTLEARYGPRARRAVLNAADRLHHQFVREAYHEIIRIVSPLDAALLNLDRDLTAIPAVPEHMREHVRCARERVLLIAEFLDNLRAFTADARPDFTCELLLPIVNEAIELALSHIELPLCGVDVRRQIDGSLRLEADRSRLLQALINLIVNAIEACAEQSRPAMLIISASPHMDAHVKIAIADNGCGMSDEALHDCALLYSSGKPNGMGFGLPLAKKIIEIDHNGALTLESESAVGTTATVILPIEQLRLQD